MTGKFCTKCGARVVEGKRFCHKCGEHLDVQASLPTPAEGPPAWEGNEISSESKQVESTDISGELNAANSDDQVAKVLAEARTDRMQTSTPSSGLVPVGRVERAGHGGNRLFFALTMLVLLVIAGGGLWFMTRPQPQPVVLAPPNQPISGQVADLRPTQGSLLNSPLVTSSPISAPDNHNVQGIAIFKSEDGTQSFVYPNGSQFFLDAKIFSISSPPTEAFSEDYGTVLINSSSPKEDSPSAWQVQFRLDQAKDINGDGFPEVVLSDYSGGAHCCTTLAVISLRPQGPVIVFDTDLGSGGASFRDLDGDRRLEIRRDYLFEYALGSFAQGTFNVPVIYSADRDGVYRINTRAFARLMSTEYDSAAAEYQKATYDAASGQAEDRDLINMFFLAYLAGRRADSFDALSRLKPLADGMAHNPDPLAILEDALTKVSPEVLREPEWIRLKAGQPIAPAQAPFPDDARTPRPAPTVDGFGTQAPAPIERQTPNAQITPALQRWAQAMESNNPSEIATCYAAQVDRYFLRQDVTNSFIRDYMQHWIVDGNRRVIKFVPMDIVFDTQTDSLVTFHLIKHVITTDARGNSERFTRSQLSMKRDGGGWAITSERDFK